jgi:cyclopropane fatty-acyl-phospholipid synthase-like methyltransferase
VPVQPNFLERLALVRFDKGPAPLLDLFGASGFETVCLARDLGVFDSLADGPLSADDLAARIDADPGGVRLLAEYLAAQNYLAATGDGYERTEMTRRWLTDAEGTNMGPWFEFWRDLVFPFWRENAADAVREGGPGESFYDWLGDDEAKWQTAQRGFRSAASLLAPRVVDAATLPEGADSLLDVGGGHGLYAIRFCERHSGLSATVLDRPAALDVAREDAADAGVADRVATRGGDYETDDWGEGYDAVLLFNVIHGHDPAEVRALLERAHDALAPGGRLLVLDQLQGTVRMPVATAGLALVAVTYFVLLDATIHDVDDVATWLRAAGFGDVTRESFRTAPGVTLLEATRQ